MKPRTVVYLVVFLVLLVFVLANWTEIARPTELNLLAARVNAPLGVLLLLIVGAILALDAIVHALSRHAWNRERRALTQELEQLRQRADEAEESRIHALRETLERETALIRTQLDRVLASLPSRRGPDAPYAAEPRVLEYNRPERIAADDDGR